MPARTPAASDEPASVGPARVTLSTLKLSGSAP